MQIVTIEQADHQVLRQPAQEIKFPLSQEVQQVIDDMKSFIENLASPFGKPAGLAAPQVGHSLRIIFYQIPPEAKDIRKEVDVTVPLTALINPSYTPVKEEGKSIDWEGCYSVPDKMGEVYRYNVIEYQAYTPEGKKISGIARGFQARVIQHEVGHLNGELYTDLIKKDACFGPVDAMLEIRRAQIQNQKENID